MKLGYSVPTWIVCIIIVMVVLEVSLTICNFLMSLSICVLFGLV